MFVNKYYDCELWISLIERLIVDILFLLLGIGKVGDLSLVSLVIS